MSLQTRIATLVQAIGADIKALFAGKVDKVEGQSLITEAERTKLDGIQAGATLNSTDAQLRNRSTHTGTQAVSTVAGLQAALDNKINTTERGVSGGVATLDEFARIPSSQLPSYVDDVLEFPTLANFPAVGEGGKIYIAVNQGTHANPTRQYRWTGSVYAEINPSPGTTDALAEGSTNLYFSEHRVRNTLLTGLSMAVSTAITAADTVLSALGKLQAQLGQKANLDSPTFTGNPTAPTAAADDNDTSLATTAFVRAAMALFGVGAQVPLVTRDLNTLFIPGLYSCSGSSLNAPVANNAVLVCVEAYEGDRVTQTATMVADTRRWFRVTVGGVNWGPWQELWHTGNFDPATKQDKSALVTTATSRTLALADAWNYVRPSTTGAVTLTVPTNAAVAFDIGTEITIRSVGSVTLAPGSGVTLNAPSGGTLLLTNNMTVTLKKVATNVWDVIGQTVAA